MKTIVHKANTRGHANHGWLNTYHTFSFAGYFDSERVHFGALRVLNDDWIAQGMGFGTHPHDNMEIITIPLKGMVEHKDSMGNHGTISAGEIQVMSAGTGVYHSEFNPDPDVPLELLQIWVLPNTRNVSPRYDQMSVGESLIKNQFNQILSPEPGDAGVWIHQQAWFYLGDFTEDVECTYSLHEASNGVYVFIIEGSILLGDLYLETRDGAGISEAKELYIKSCGASRVLLMEVPMQLR